MGGPGGGDWEGRVGCQVDMGVGGIRGVLMWRIDEDLDCARPQISV
jgi:hypothetical protein